MRIYAFIKNITHKGNLDVPIPKLLNI